jgi:hypothetical protein
LAIDERLVLKEIAKSIENYSFDGKFKQRLGAFETNLKRLAKKGKIAPYDFDRSLFVIRQFKRVKL